MEDKLYTTAEIMLATGLPRGTITTRAMRLGFKRNGIGYTSDQIFQIVTQPLQLHRKSEENALELREELNHRIEENNLPMRIEKNWNGEWKLQYRKEG